MHCLRRNSLRINILEKETHLGPPFFLGGCVVFIPGREESLVDNEDIMLLIILHARALTRQISVVRSAWIFVSPVMDSRCRLHGHRRSYINARLTLHAFYPERAIWPHSFVALNVSIAALSPNICPDEQNVEFTSR